jgi:NDP-sugar pyrophosphorylase family protein
MEEQSFYGRRLKGYWLSAVDIDTPADYEEAKRIANEQGVALK